jgi:hypothetical protein
MFKVKWIARFDEHRPIAVEDSVLTDVDRIFVSCKERLSGKKFKRFGPAPDGFLVCDEDGRELRRWVDAHLEPHEAVTASKTSAWLPSRRRARRALSSRDLSDYAGLSGAS